MTRRANAAGGGGVPRSPRRPARRGTLSLSVARRGRRAATPTFRPPRFLPVRPSSRPTPPPRLGLGGRRRRWYRPYRQQSGGRGRDGCLGSTTARREALDGGLSQFASTLSRGVLVILQCQPIRHTAKTDFRTDLSPQQDRGGGDSVSVSIFTLESVHPNSRGVCQNVTCIRHTWHKVIMCRDCSESINP